MGARASEATPSDESPRPPAGWGARHTIVLLLFFGLCLSHVMRNSLAVAIVAMVKQGRNGNEWGGWDECACVLCTVG